MFNRKHHDREHHVAIGPPWTARSARKCWYLTNLRRVLWRTAEACPEAQAVKLAWVERIHPGLHRAWALKEGWRWVCTLTRQGFSRLAIAALDLWLSWARRSQLPLRAVDPPPP